MRYSSSVTIVPAQRFVAFALNLARCEEAPPDSKGSSKCPHVPDCTSRRRQYLFHLICRVLFQRYHILSYPAPDSSHGFAFVPAGGGQPTNAAELKKWVMESVPFPDAGDTIRFGTDLSVTASGVHPFSELLPAFSKAIDFAVSVAFSMGGFFSFKNSFVASDLIASGAKTPKSFAAQLEVKLEMDENTPRVRVGIEPFLVRSGEVQWNDLNPTSLASEPIEVYVLPSGSVGQLVDVFHTAYLSPFATSTKPTKTGSCGLTRRAYDLREFWSSLYGIELPESIRYCKVSFGGEMHYSYPTLCVRSGDLLQLKTTETEKTAIIEKFLKIFASVEWQSNTGARSPLFSPVHSAPNEFGSNSFQRASGLSPPLTATRPAKIHLTIPPPRRTSVAPLNAPVLPAQNAAEGSDELTQFAVGSPVKKITLQIPKPAKSVAPQTKTKGKRKAAEHKSSAKKQKK